MTADDDLERRLRDALTRPRTTDSVDTEDFLGRVHHGAKVRRAKRGVTIAVASVLAVAGGGLAVNATGVLTGSKAPVADGPQTPTGFASRSTPPPTTPPATTGVTSPSDSKVSQQITSAPTTVTVSPGGFIPAGSVRPVSLTATGTAHQWVLGETPGADCARASCATVFSTADHGASWTDVGQLPAAPATSDAPTPASVSQLRFAMRSDGSAIYDGWAYGNALWTTHDSGRTWSDASAPPGHVTALESWGDSVYAGVSSPVPGDDTAQLYRASTKADDWTAVPVSPQGLTSVQSLAAAHGVVGLIDGGNGHSSLWLSSDGVTWQQETDECPTGFDPLSLSTAASAVGVAPVVGSLWVTCQSPTASTIEFTSTDNLGTWVAADNGGLFPRAVTVAAQSPTAAYVVGANATGIEKVDATTTSTPGVTADVGVPVFFGFTNDRYGYLISSDGTMVATTDGGTTWQPYAVTDTSP